MGLIRPHIGRATPKPTKQRRQKAPKKARSHACNNLGLGVTFCETSEAFMGRSKISWVRKKVRSHTMLKNLIAAWQCQVDMSWQHKKSYDLISCSFWNWGKGITLISVLFQNDLQARVGIFKSLLYQCELGCHTSNPSETMQRAAWSDYCDTAAPCLHLARFLLQTIWQWPTPGIWRYLADHPYRHIWKGFWIIF